ncbi:hypothetical protein [Undibacterium sp. Ren11W]|uniref:hypothetical protein n=1 Tax=Undibacterium sp. Ren11W TaxID=3413045 RepID=UPI003BEFBE97
MATTQPKNKAPALAKSNTSSADVNTEMNQAADTKRYIVNVVINHDDELYEIGAVIALTDKQATALLTCGAITDPVDTDEPV